MSEDEAAESTVGEHHCDPRDAYNAFRRALGIEERDEVDDAE